RVRVTRGAGSRPHLASSVLQEGLENANINAGLGFIWRISDRGASGGYFLRSEDDPHGSQEARRFKHRTTLEGIPSASRDASARACRRRPRNAGANQPL